MAVHDLKQSLVALSLWNSVSLVRADRPPLVGLQMQNGPSRITLWPLPVGHIPSLNDAVASLHPFFFFKMETTQNEQGSKTNTTPSMQTEQIIKSCGSCLK